MASVLPAGGPALSMVHQGLMPVGTAGRLPRARHVLRLHGGYVDHMKQTLVVKLVLKTAVSPDHL